jgi:hypothetical protein
MADLFLRKKTSGRGGEEEVGKMGLVAVIFGGLFFRDDLGKCFFGAPSRLFWRPRGNDFFGHAYVNSLTQMALES